MTNNKDNDSLYLNKYSILFTLKISCDRPNMFIKPRKSKIDVPVPSKPVPNKQILCLEFSYLNFHTS